ncbi:site-specific integrase [Sphingobium sp. Cam5-1]|uniref:site-specific integrase n=1 Tax=Sphingobium sp. Cam5-1 TaxID=2789327 RepID=UPI0018AD0F49|nr:site-specific integrase [Sphingobium sp. Cam5-1]QPI75527.1 site-specific integrase [Sphingobium sp. Cam5-1]
MARRRLDRTLRLDPTPVNHPAEIAEIRFHNEWGKVAQRFDPALFGMPSDITTALARAFRDHDVASSAATRTARWFALRVFGRFLREDGRIGRAADLDMATIRRFITWLAKPTNGRRRGVVSQSGQLSMVRPVLNRAIADNPGLFAPDFAVPNNAIPLAGTQRLPQERLTPAQMRSVLAACYAEIDAAWEKFQYGQAVIALPELPPRPSWRGEGLDRWIWRLHRANDGLSPGGKGLRRLGFRQKSLPKAHKIASVEGYLHITTDTLTAFYIALLIQTAANAGPLRQIKRDCLVPHPLDRNRIMVEWVKPRAGGKVKRLQRRSFDNRRPYAAPRLIEKMLAMTEPLLPHVEASERNRLFLHRFLMTTGRLEREYQAGHIVQATLRSAMLRFYERQNAAIASWNEAHSGKARPLLPDFSPKLFRSSMASAHYTASQGDIMAAKAVLNHASIVTTDIYVDGEAVRRLERDTIARLQSLMIRWVGGETPTHRGRSRKAGADTRVTVLFGHDCLNPTDSAHARPGRMCPKLGGCLACPGLVVPIDLGHLARIVQAMRHLEMARERIDPIRFGLFYTPSLQVLTQDLLPAFPPEMMPAAERIMSALPPLPDLE